MAKVAILVMIMYQRGAPDGSIFPYVDRFCIRQANVVPTHFIFSFHYHHIFIAPNMYYWTHKRAMLNRKVGKKICLISYYSLAVI